MEQIISFLILLFKLGQITYKLYLKLFGRASFMNNIETSSNTVSAMFLMMLMFVQKYDV